MTLSRVILLLLGVVSFAKAAVPSGVSVTLEVVGIPGLMGPPRIYGPEFVPPALETILLPEQTTCLIRKGAGNYEALVSTDGTVANLQSRHEPIEGTECERRNLFPHIMKWRFKPATLDGEPTAVYMAIRLTR